MLTELLYVIMFLGIWIVIPYFIGRWLYGKVAKKVKWASKNKYLAALALLLCAFVGWVMEVLIITGIKQLL